MGFECTRQRPVGGTGRTLRPRSIRNRSGQAPSVDQLLGDARQAALEDLFACLGLGLPELVSGQAPR